jgi:Ni/Co efflux regulator RcnB
MKRIVLAIALFAGSVGLASAQGVDIDVGRSGVHVDPGYDHGHDRDWRWRHRETTGFGRDCRVIVRHIWRDGERITERRRICD